MEKLQGLKPIKALTAGMTEKEINEIVAQLIEAQELYRSQRSQEHLHNPTLMARQQQMSDKEFIKFAESMGATGCRGTCEPHRVRHVDSRVIEPKQLSGG